MAKVRKSKKSIDKRHSVTPRNRKAMLFNAGKSKPKINTSLTSVKTLHAKARLERLKKGLDSKPENVVKLSKLNERLSFDKVFIRDDVEICKKRKIRRNEIMAKTRGRGLRVRHTNWNADSFVQCRS